MTRYRSEPAYLWGHTPCVPGRGWRGAVPPLTPNGNGARHERRTRRAGLTLADLVRRYRGKWDDAPARKLQPECGSSGVRRGAVPRQPRRVLRRVGWLPAISGPRASPEDALEAADDDTLRTVPGGAIRDGGAGRFRFIEVKGRAGKPRPVARALPGVVGSLVPCRTSHVPCDDAATRQRRRAENALGAFLERLRNFTVLDPACGLGQLPLPRPPRPPRCGAPSSAGG